MYVPDMHADGWKRCVVCRRHSVFDRVHALSDCPRKMLMTVAIYSVHTVCAVHVHSSTDRKKASVIRESNARQTKT